MNLYFELLQYPVFNRDIVDKYYNNAETARTALKKLLKNGTAAKIRKNLYTCISGETGSPVANRFQIACAINDTTYISHHTAMEYYGVSNQVYYDVYVSSDKKFSEFVFDGYNFQHVSSKLSEGVEDIEYSGGVRITDRERTIVDSIKDIDRIAGIEEVMANIEGLTRVSEEKLLKYMSLYANQFLFQKIGYLLLPLKSQLELSDNFFDHCKNKVGKSTRYLTNESMKGIYDKGWKLIVPENIFQARNGEMNDRV